MGSERQKVFELSKLLSLVLRHRPGDIGLVLDGQGWANVNDLIKKVNACAYFGSPFQVDKNILDIAVATNNKKRFEYNSDKTQIRARQGHSIEVDLGLIPVAPPSALYHGTSKENRVVILTDGIKKMSRNHVHLSEDAEVANKVGQRHGDPIIFVISTSLMHSDGFKFFKSSNGVWLTDHVPVNYIIGEVNVAAPYVTGIYINKTNGG